VEGYRVGAAAGPDESALVVLRYANGAVGTIAHSWELAGPLGGLRLSKVQGTRGSVTFESHGLAVFTTGRRPSIKLPVLGDPLGYRAMFSDFQAALWSGAPTRYTLEMARRDLRLLEAAEASMAERAARLGAPPLAGAAE
jgi:predicted dehydrogenase